METILGWLFSGLLGVIIGVYLNTYLSKKYLQRHHRLSLKLDVLTRFLGNRYFLHHNATPDHRELFVSLNQVFVVFEDSDGVIAAVKTFYEALGTSSQDDRMISLIKAMADAAGIDVRKLNDSFLLTPFVPGEWTNSDPSCPTQ